MNAVTHNHSGIIASDAIVPARASRFRVPRRLPSPKGRGQGPMRELMGFIATRSETYAFRYDDGEWMFSSTNREMLAGSMDALRTLGITVDHRIEQTDSPKSFLVVGPDGSSRTLEFSWDSIDYDLMSMSPHVKRIDPALAALIVITCIAACWAGIYAVAHWISQIIR